MRAKNVMMYINKIRGYMPAGEYVYIEDVAVDLLVPDKHKPTSFTRAYKELVAVGELELCGNQIRINQ